MLAELDVSTQIVKREFGFPLNIKVLQALKVQGFIVVNQKVSLEMLSSLFIQTKAMPISFCKNSFNKIVVMT